MVNITSPSATDTIPAASLLPDALVGFQHDSTQYTYASPSGSTNDVTVGIPRFLGIVRVSVSLLAGTATWTGFASGVDGQQVVLRNVDANNTLTLSTGGTGLGDPLSLPQNRFYGQNDYRLPPGGQITMIYYAWGSFIGWSIG